MGVAIGRSAWGVVAAADMANRPVAPVGTLALGALSTLLAANLVAAGPAWDAIPGRRWPPLERDA